MTGQKWTGVRGQIRRVLLGVWDPIGIKNEPNAQDEYDGYVEAIYELLRQHVSEADLSGHLLYVVHELMGLDGAKMIDMEPTAKALKRIQIG
jgi:hypothetical protein